jgi:hypothetical protein
VLQPAPEPLEIHVGQLGGHRAIEHTKWLKAFAVRIASRPRFFKYA